MVRPSIAAFVLLALTALPSEAQVLDKSVLLSSETFWDNRDWDWYAENIPFFECPDEEITTTYYYRWELLTKHLTYGSPNSGYSFTEFIDRPFWSGTYGAISCPAGHQLYEARWLRSPRVAQDYLKYWFRTPGAQPRNYSTWLADSAWAVHQVHPDQALLEDLLPDLIRNYEGWEQRHFVPEVGLFWQTGHDDGMEFNINSRQTQDILRGAPSYRPSFNAYMWADAMAIARIANLVGQPQVAERFQAKAAALKSKMQELLWDEERQFFFPALRDDEQRDGHVNKALSLTYQTGKFAGDPHGRELIGYVPWQFNMLDTDRGFEVAWAKLMDPDAFFAAFGPSTVERHDPLFLLMDSCCWWSGQSWPYATTQTLKAMANVLRNPEISNLPISADDYLKMLHIYAVSHRKDGKPYLAEAMHPDTGSFEGHDAYNHSEHYLHSSYCDLIITGLAGVQEQADDSVVIEPLAPASWEYFALDDVIYHGHRLSVLWDKSGTRYGLGPGFHVLADEKKVATSSQLKRMRVEWPPAQSLEAAADAAGPINYAVNNDGDYYPRLQASFVADGTSLSKINDGNYWYHISPPNRWTSVGSPHPSDTIDVDFGTARSINQVKLYFLEDAEHVKVPADYELQAWDGQAWQTIENQTRTPEPPTGHRANTVAFPARDIQKLRVVLHHTKEFRSGLTELEAWGEGNLPYTAPPPPAGNLAFHSRDEEFPVATASYTDRFGGNPMSAIDGKIIFLPTPMNRWTSYESPTPTDWLELDFGKPQTIAHVDLHIYDDRGGVQPPESYAIQYHDGEQWRDVSSAEYAPAEPTGNIVNTTRFDPVKTSRMRVVFTHRGAARSGVTEMEVWGPEK